MKHFLLALSVSLCASLAHAEILTAVCRSPQGITIASGNSVQVEADGFGSGLFTYSWEVGKPDATIITQSGEKAGSVPATEKAVVIVGSKIVTFGVTYGSAVWIHSLFPERKVVLISRHVQSDAKGVVLGGTYHASCSIAVQ